ncbi:unnamed protein product, partial [Ectocarpus sp. 8 AP-2014]
MSGASGGSTHAPTRCLYVTLQVANEAAPFATCACLSATQVGNEAEAQVRFQELQHAYAVLSNAHERKWYDDHRDEILNPARYEGDGDSDDGAGGRTVNVTPFFSAAAFSGFGDDESGFYQTYTRAFREVWDAERDWGEASSDGSGWGQGSLPEMGGSKDSYETAEEFYGTWSGFVSGLSFGWVDEYNVNEAENRRVRRLMEKENSKKRAIARRKYQDDVHALVDFCRRRDRRVIRYKLKLAKDKEEREKRRQEEALNQKEDMKRRKQEWARAKQEEEEAEEEVRARAGGDKAFRLDDEDNDDDDEDDGTGSEPEEGDRHRKRNAKRRAGRGGKGRGGKEQEVTVFVCAVCKKDFKSKGQMTNHETSKAHKKKLKELDAEMLREAMAKTAGRKGMEGEGHGNSSSASEDGSSDAEVASSEGEGDFFLDSAMRDLDLDGSSHSQTATADRKKGASLSASAGSDSDEEEPKPAGSRSGGEAKMQPQNRGRGLFDFGSSSEENSSGSSSDSDSDSSDSGSSGSGSGGGSGSGSGSGSDSGSGDNDEDDPNLFETIATASEAANQIDPDGDMRTAAAVAASAAAVAAANAATDRFHLGGDLGSAVSAATSAGLSWWKKHNAEASDGEEDADMSMRAGESDDSEAGTKGKHRKNSKGDHDHNHSPAKGKHRREHAAKRAHGHSKAGTHEGEQGRRRHAREEDQDDSEHRGKKGNPAKGQQTGHARGRGAHQRSPNETRSSSSSGARSDDGSTDSR